MKKLVLAAGVLLGFAVFFPNGINVSKYFSKPVAVDDVAVSAEPDAAIVKALTGATAADKARVVSVYTGLKEVLNRDNAARVNTTEKFEELHARTLQMAIATPGKYEGLDAAIEAVFAAAVKDADTDPSVVNPVTLLMQSKLVKACDVIIASAR
jgi:hypothetical protein